MTGIEERYRAAILARRHAEEALATAEALTLNVQQNEDDCRKMLTAARNEFGAARAAYEERALAGAQPAMATDGVAYREGAVSVTPSGPASAYGLTTDPTG